VNKVPNKNSHNIQEMKITILVFLLFLFFLILFLHFVKYPREIRDLISKEEGDYILNQCKHQFFRDRSFSRGKTSTCFLPKNDPVVEPMLKRMCRLIGKNYENVEDPEIVKYEPNGNHALHYDRRATTVTLFLNDSFEGGEINFPLSREKIKPPKYGGVVFQTKNNPFSLHKNIPVYRGEKYVVYIWINE